MIRPFVFNGLRIEDQPLTPSAVSFNFHEVSVKFYTVSVKFYTVSVSL